VWHDGPSQAKNKGNATIGEGVAGTYQRDEQKRANEQQSAGQRENECEGRFHLVQMF